MFTIRGSRLSRHERSKIALEAGERSKIALEAGG